MTTRGETINIRLDASERDLLRRAAAATHATLSDFVRRASFIAAESALVDRTRIPVSGDAWTAYLASLDAPAEVTPALLAALAAPDPFE